MSFLLDLIILGYIAWRAWRGSRRGFAKELPDAFSITIFFLCGWGMFKIMYRGLSEASKLLGQSVGILSFIGLLVASVALWRRFKGHVRRLAERWPDERVQRRGGALAGGIGAFVTMATLLLVLAHWPLHGLTRWIAESSHIGQVLVRWVMPVYQKTHGVL